MPHPTNLLFSFAVTLLPALALAQTDAPLFKALHEKPVFGVAFSPDGKLLASSGDDRKLLILDTATGKTVHRLNSSTPLRGVAFGPDGTTVATVDSGGIMTVWDIVKGQQTKVSPSHNNHNFILAFSTDGTTLTAAGHREYSFWEYTRGSMSSTSSGRQPTGSFVALSHEGKTVAWGNPDGNIQFLEPRGGNYRTLKVGPARAAAFTPDGQQLVSGNVDRQVRVWDIAKPKEVQKFTGCKMEPGHVAVSADGKTLAVSGRKEAYVHVWKLTTGRELCQFAGQGAEVHALTLSADGKWLATGSEDGRVRWWNLEQVNRPLDVAKNLTARDLEAMYADLSSDKADKARLAFAHFRANAEAAVQVLSDRVRQSAALTINPRLSQLILDLDADEYADREKASAELAKLGESAVPAMRRTMARNPSPEVRDRLARLLAQFDERAALSSELVRVMEAVELLEQIGTPNARRALESLARESLVSVVQQEVSAAVERLGKR